MALTSYQKHYIKKNIGHRDPEEIAFNLHLPPKEVLKFIKKHYSQRKIRKISGTKDDYDRGRQKISDFSFKNFLADNLNYFLLLFILVFASYANSLDNAFVSDDIATILKNPDIGKFGTINEVAPYLVGSLRTIMNFLTFKLAGLTPAPYRMINLLSHLGSVWVIFIILNLISQKRIALFASALFAVHPILIESVTWISGGPYSMYGFFALLSFLLYLLSKSSKKIYHASVFAFLFAILSSDKVLFFPILLAAYELSAGKLKENWKNLSAFVIIDVFLVIKSLLAIGGRIQVLESASYQNLSGMVNPFVKIPTALATYLKLIFWPEKLSLYQTEVSLGALGLFLCSLAFLALLGLAVYGWKKNKFIFFWLSFFIIALSPTLTPFKISWVVAERYVYLGSLGIFVIVAMFFDWLIRKFGQDGRYKLSIYAVFAVIILSLSVRTVLRNMDWQNEDSLWTATAKTSPSGPSTHNNMGDVYSRSGDLEKAEAEFKRAIELNPLYAEAYHNLGLTYVKMKKNPEAIEALQKSLQINPNLWQSYQNLGIIYFNQQDYKTALEYNKKALEINPNDPVLNENLKLMEDKLK